MRFPERFLNLPPYAFARLRALLDGHAPGGAPLHMSIGEPRHDPPAWLGEVLAAELAGFGAYPPNEGAPELLGACADWLARRYGVTVDPEREVMALNGTREGLFNAAIALCPETAREGTRPVILTPNPFYQVYAVAALAVGAEPVYVPATPATGNLPDYTNLPAALLDRTEIAYLCSPANPQGAVATEAYWRELLALAERHGFRVFADECYSEIYRDTPPVGALQVAQAMGADPERLVIFHSLSKRSNLPGLRAGFAAGGPASIARMRALRAYAGAPLPLPLQRVGARVWADEDHVDASRALYAQKYELADTILAGVPGYAPPPAGFFLWLPVPGGDGEATALALWRGHGVRVLPGGYLARAVHGRTPGTDHIRVAMVAGIDDIARGLTAIRDHFGTGG